MKISVCIIVKNEQELIARCLQSVKDADEIIVLDTGSTDLTGVVINDLNLPNVRFIEGVYGWKDDFADARNAALDYCTGDWRLVIDADEVLTVGSMDKLRLSIATAKGRTLSVRVRGEGTNSIHMSVRAFTRGVQYVGAAHEVPNVRSEGVCEAEIVFGYSPAHALDPDRMIRILSKEMLKSPNDTRIIYYFAREHWYRKQYSKAEELFERHVRLSSFLGERADAYLYLARIYWLTCRGDKARSACMNAITINADFKEALLFMADISFEHNAKRWQEYASYATNERVLFVRTPSQIPIDMQAPNP